MNAKERLLVSLTASLSLLASCGGSDSSQNDFLVVQDLNADPTGFTTAIEFPNDALPIGPASFEADGGQVAQSSSLDSDDPTRLLLTWDERVTPSSQVRILGQDGISEAFQPVATTDDSAPTYVVEGASQGLGLGADVIMVAFSGPRVIPEVAEDGSNWSLVLGTASVSLEDSMLEFDAVSYTHLTLPTKA